MKSLPEVEPLAGTHRRTAVGVNRAEMTDLLWGLRPGRYTTAMLYPRYEVWAENHGKDPVNRNSFGASLRNFVGVTRTHRGGAGGGKEFDLGIEHVSGPSLKGQG